MQTKDNTILVTGGTSGIGLELARQFLVRDNRVIVTGRSHATIDAAVTGTPGLIGYVLDLDTPSSIKDDAAAILQRHPDLNTLVANAGISGKEDLLSDDWLSHAERLVATNVIGTLATVDAFLPHLIRRDRATLMVTSSKLAYLPSSAFPTYCATKAFMHSWLQSLRYQLRATSVEVLELLPPYVATKLLGPQQLEDPRAMPLDAFVAEVMALIEAGDMPDGEILVQRAMSDRLAEREGRYGEAFAVMNPA